MQPLSSVRHCTERELEGTVSLPDAIGTLREAFIARAEGAAPVQMRIATDFAGLRLNTMAAIIPALGVCGAKVYTALNAEFSFAVLLFSIEDGRLLATLEANGLTKLRTAAVSTLAAMHLARGDSASLAIFGTGTQAAGHAAALAAQFPLKEILVVGRASAPAFARKVQGATGLPAQVVEVREALQRADIVVTATRSRTPLFDGADLREGCCLLAIGSARPDAVEIDAASFARASCICVEDVGQARHEAGDLIAAEAGGTPVWHRLTELGAILSNRARGRAGDADITVFESIGFALEDIAIAALAWSRVS